MAKFTEADIGKRVVLLENEIEGWPREEGKLIRVQNSIFEMVLVEVDDEYLNDDFDDGLRELEAADVELA